ncbi:hypothetical protein Gotur_026243, partial [Gossypium turneri]
WFRQLGDSTRDLKKRVKPRVDYFLSFCGSEKLFLREVFTFVQDRGSLSGYICTYVFLRFSSPCSHREMYSPELNSVHALIHIRLLDRKLIMEKGFLDKVEDNEAARTWSETTQREKGDSLAEGYISKL